MTKEDLVLGGDVVENRCDSWKADVEWIQRMLNNRPQIQLHKKLQVLATPRQFATSKCDDVKNCLAHCVEDDMSFWVLVPVEIACFNVVVRPFAEMLQVDFERLRRQKFGTR